MVRMRLSIAWSVVSLVICLGIGLVHPSPVPGTPQDSLASSRFLQVPFEGSFQLTNGFDHHHPGTFEDPGTFVAVTGETWVPAPNHPCGRTDGHAGYDWPLSPGTPILAAAAGWVVQAGPDPLMSCPVLGRVVRGVGVRLVHRLVGLNPERYETVYSHLSQVKVRVGQWVGPGTVIGLSGNTGCSTGPHLHFEVRRLTRTQTGRPTPVDPYGWQGQGPDPWAVDPEGAVSETLWLLGKAPPLGACSE